MTHLTKGRGPTYASEVDCALKLLRECMAVEAAQLCMRLPPTLRERAAVLCLPGPRQKKACTRLCYCAPRISSRQLAPKMRR